MCATRAFLILQKKALSASTEDYDEPHTCREHGDLMTKMSMSALLHHHRPVASTGGERFQDADGRESVVIISHEGQW